MTWLRWLWGEISRNRNFFQLLFGANGLGNVPLGVLWPRQNSLHPHDQKRYESTWEASKQCTARGWCQKVVQGLVDQPESRERLKCQGVFMCTPLWRGTMAVYRFLASAQIKMPNGWRTIKLLVHKIRLHGRRGKRMAESFSREKLRHAPLKEGGWEILCDLLPVWPRLVRSTNLMSRMNGKKTHTHTHYYLYP